MSLTRTLTLLVTSTVLLIALIASIWSYIESNHELEELFDAELAQSTRIVQGLVRHLVDTQAIEQLPATLSETLTLPLDPAVELDLEADEDEILPGGVGHKYEKKLAFEVWTPEREPLLDTLNSDDNLGLAPVIPGPNRAAIAGAPLPCRIRKPDSGYAPHNGKTFEANSVRNWHSGTYCH